jgi:hypothetical protein
LLLWKNRLGSNLINNGNETENGTGCGPDNTEYKAVGQTVQSTRLWARQYRVQGCGPDSTEYKAWQENKICLFPTTTFAQGERDLNFTTHLHVLPRLRMSRAVTKFLYILSCHGIFLTGNY